MNELGAIGGLIGVVCVLVGLFLQIKKQVAEQRATEAEAAAKLRRRTLIEGYSQAIPAINRVVDLLNGIIGMSPSVDRQITRAITLLNEVTEGSPDDSN